MFRSRMKSKTINSLSNEVLIKLLTTADTKVRIYTLRKLNAKNIHLIRDLKLDKDENRKVRFWAREKLSPQGGDSSLLAAATLFIIQ